VIDHFDTLPDGTQSVGDVAAFVDPAHFGEPGWLERGRSDDAVGGAEMRFSKMALIARNSASFDVGVVDSEVTGTVLGWYAMEPESPVGSVHVEACDGREGVWSVYAGGVWTSGPGCVTVEVSGDEREPHQVAVPVGTACPTRLD